MRGEMQKNTQLYQTKTRGETPENRPGGFYQKKHLKRQTHRRHVRDVTGTRMTQTKRGNTDIGVEVTRGRAGRRIP